LEFIFNKFINVNSPNFNKEFKRKLILMSSTLQVNEYDKEISAENEENILNNSIEDYITFFRKFLDKKNENENDNQNEEDINEANKNTKENNKEENQKKDEKKIYQNKIILKKEKEKINEENENIDFKNIRNIKMMKKQSISIYKKVDLISKKLNPNNNSNKNIDINNNNNTENKEISKNTLKINFSLSDNSSENINKIQERKYNEIFTYRKNQEPESGLSGSSESDCRKSNSNY
jgi:hypothetical protein